MPGFCGGSHDFFIRSASILFVCLVVSSCISPYETHTPFHEQLVVQGMITDQPGPYLVSLAKTLPVEDTGDDNTAVTSASVYLQDDQGNGEQLVEATPGNYYTRSTQGVVGRSYSITITTREGTIYQSALEKMSPVGDFTNLHYEFNENEVPDYTNQIHSTNGFKIYLDSEVLPEQEQRVWWRWTGTYEIFTYPQFRTKRVTKRGGGDVVIPAPPACSAYYIRLDSALVGPFRDCTCCTCWVTQFSTSPIISDFQFVNDGKISHFYLDFIEANCRTFYQKYYLKVDQLSLSPAVYEFWKGVKTQDSNGTNLFQTPPPRTVGNIKAITADAPPVVGYFAASSIKSHDLVIDRTDVPYPMRQIDTLIVECTRAFPFSTTTKPDFW